MPDRDPLQQLASFGTGGPVDPLPATEVRRLGDQRRARRTAVSAVTGVVAVLAVVVPAGLYAARDGGGRPLPPSSTETASTSPMPDESPSGGWRTDIPAGFPLLTGLPERNEAGESPQVVASEEVEPAPFCGTDLWTYDAVVNHRDVGVDNPEAFTGRVIATYPTGNRARQALADARAALAGCAVDPGSPGDQAELINTVWPRDVAGADESLVVTTQYRLEGTQAFMPGQSTWLLARVGNAVYATVDSGEGGAGIDGAEPGVTEVLTDAPVMTAAMCIYAADPCGDPSDGPSDSTTPDGTVDHATTAIPSDFPIGLGSPDLGDAATVNGTPAGERMTHADPCASKGILDRAPVDRLDYDLMGPEFTEQRELRTYPSPEAAQAALDNLATAAAACPTQELKTGVTATWTVLERSTGYHSVTVARTLGEEGGFTWQYTRVGLAIFGVVWLGEGGSPEQIRINADELTAITKQVAPKMCPFTKAGC